MIDNQTISQIKDRIDIVDVVGDFINLKKSGSSYKALSPFSSEKTPSFFVSPSKQIFKCFSTGKGGDAIEFLMLIDGLSYVEALEYLAKKYGSPMAPRDLQEEALMNQFSFWVMTELEQDSLILMFTDGLGRAGGHPEWQNRGGPEQVQKNLNRALDALEAWLSDGRSYLVGDRFTVADFNVVSVFEWLLRGKFDLSKHHPHVKKYVEMHLARQEQSKM